MPRLLHHISARYRGAWGKWGASDCIWDSALQNTPKNARRVGTHPDGWHYKLVARWLCGPQYVQRDPCDNR